ncbi:hypothetical protein BC833DRAFT_613964 [Globomyces pollinis-pini]|nr:hypothetical protein BC833DRAFT_613964 [Globomyces pollinis-pini]
MSNTPPILQKDDHQQTANGGASAINHTQYPPASLPYNRPPTYRPHSNQPNPHAPMAHGVGGDINNRSSPYLPHSQPPLTHNPSVRSDGYSTAPGAYPYGSDLGHSQSVRSEYGLVSHQHHNPGAQPSTNYYPAMSTNANRDADTVSVRSAATAMTSQSTLVVPVENLEQYRQQVKNSHDPVMQFDFAKRLIEVAEGLEAAKVKKNRDILHNEAVRFLKKAASANYNGKIGVPEALFFLAECYGNGTLGLSVDHEKAFGYYSQAAKHGHPSSIYRTGVCYEVGAGPKRDHSRAIQLYKKAALLGDTAAMFKVGMILINGTLGQNRNPREGVNFIKRAASQADETAPFALHELAVLYEGINNDPALGVVPDLTYAYDLYFQSAKLGYSLSQYRLGLAFEYGHLNLHVDPRRSIKWYSDAARQGNPDAELALSGWYLTGFENVLRQSDKEAYLWAKKAADKGLAKAEYAVAYFLENGVGVQKDLDEARRWYTRAASQGNQRAIARLKSNGHSKGAGKASEWRKEEGTSDGNCVVM